MQLATNADAVESKTSAQASGPSKTGLLSNMTLSLLTHSFSSKKHPKLTLSNW